MIGSIAGVVPSSKIRQMFPPPLPVHLSKNRGGRRSGDLFPLAPSDQALKILRMVDIEPGLDGVSLGLKAL
ncbi:MAG: hypothetical protein ABGY15_07505 [bacterium]